VHPANDDGIGLRGIEDGVASAEIFPWSFVQLDVLSLMKEHNLGLNVLLSSSGLRLGQWGIVRVVHEA
jgi:hypothetical protein